MPLVDRDQQGRLGLTCPTCRQVTPIPDRGVAGLQSAFFVNHLLNIQQSSRIIESTAPSAVDAPKTANHCLIHEGRELELYCEECGEIICNKCALRGGKHHDHDYDEIDKAFKTYQVLVGSLLEPMEKQMKATKQNLALIDARRGKISHQRAITAGNIHANFKRLRDILNVRETELIGQLDQMTQGKLKDLAVQKDQIETILAQLNSCLHFVRESLQPGNEKEVLKMKKNTIRQGNELATHFQPFEPRSEADIAFSVASDVIAACREYGQLYSLGSPDPSKCVVNVKAVAEIGQWCTAILQANSFEGKLCKESITSLECELVSLITNTRASCNIERAGQSHFFEISYQPTIKGTHQLHIKAQGHSIKGSPYTIAVKLPVEKLGTPISIIGGLLEPTGVAVTPKGEVVVAELKRHCVSVYSTRGEKNRSASIQHVRGVAVDGEGNILVSCESNCVQKSTTDLQFVMAVGSACRQWTLTVFSSH